MRSANSTTRSSSRATTQSGKRKIAKFISWNGQLCAYKSPVVAVVADAEMRGNSTTAHVTSHTMIVAEISSDLLISGFVSAVI